MGVTVLAALGSQLCRFQEDDHQAVQGVYLIFGQIILGNHECPACALGRPSRCDKPKVRIVAALARVDDQLGSGFLR